MAATKHYGATGTAYLLPHVSDVFLHTKTRTQTQENLLFSITPLY